MRRLNELLFCVKKIRKNNAGHLVCQRGQHYTTPVYTLATSVGEQWCARTCTCNQRKKLIKIDIFHTTISWIPQLFVNDSVSCRSRVRHVREDETCKELHTATQSGYCACGGR